jgi:VanZ family protein
VESSRPESSVAVSRRLSLWVPVGLYCALIFGLSSVSNVPALPMSVGDKGAHTLLYAGLGFLVTRAIVGDAGRRAFARGMLGALAASALYGLSDEVHQLFVPRRTFDLLDLAADVFGGGLGSVAWWLWSTVWRYSRGN